MNGACLFIKVRSKEGQRDNLRALWEKHLKQRAAENTTQEVYFYCYDNQDQNLICMFEYYTDSEEIQHNSKTSWFQSYMQEAIPLLDGEPEVNMASPIWIKNEIS